MPQILLAAGAIVLAGVGVVNPAMLTAQAGRAVTGRSAASAPRTADGHPDLQGIWDVSTITPMERPADLPAVLTDEQARRLEGDESTRVNTAARPSDPNRSAPRAGASVGTYNYFWIDRGSSVTVVNGERRSSLIVDPPDGRMPSVTAEAQRRNANRRGTAVRPTSDAIESTLFGEYDGPEVRPLAERCLIGFGSTSGPPTLPNYGYHNLKQIVQTKDYVMISQRDGARRAHHPSESAAPAAGIPAVVRRLGGPMGRGHAGRGDHPFHRQDAIPRIQRESSRRGAIQARRRPHAPLPVHHRRSDTWERQKTGEYAWVASDQMMHEYACHESNYALGGILRGARVLEKDGPAPAPQR